MMKLKTTRGSVRRGGGAQPVRSVSGRRLGPQVAVSEGGRQRVEAGGRRRRGGTVEKQNLHTG